MIPVNDFLVENNAFLSKESPLEQVLDNNFPLEQFLKNEDAILCAKSMSEKTQKYFNSQKIKKLINLITKEPEDDNILRGYKFPYVASEILKLDCPYILERFVLSEKDYNEKYNKKNIELNGEKSENKNEVDKVFNKIEERYKNMEFKNKYNINKIDEIFEKNNLKLQKIDIDGDGHGGNLDDNENGLLKNDENKNIKENDDKEFNKDDIIENSGNNSNIINN